MNLINGRHRPGHHLHAAALLAALFLCLTQSGHADQVLLSQTTLVYGNESETVSFNAPTAGTVTVQLQNLAWPELMGSLSFMASSATQSLTAWSNSSSPSETESFQVGPGTYFAHVTGQASGPLDLGLFSLAISISPLTSPVPLPASGWILLAGLALLLGAAALLARRSSGTDGRLKPAAC
jgi:hypothetical protein